MKWKYKFIRLKVKRNFFGSLKADQEGPEETLNKYGGEGWELVSCNISTLESSLGGNNFYAVLKKADN